MNLELMKEAMPDWDEARVIGLDVETEGRISHIVGMIRQGDQAKLYVLEDAEPAEGTVLAQKAAMTARQGEPLPERHTNRESFSHIDERNFFDWVTAVIVGEQELLVESAMSACFGIPDNFLNWLMISEMMKAGWNLPEGHPFWRRDWERILLKEVVFRTPVAALPDWNKNEVRIRHGEKWEHHLLELPVRLVVGQKQEIPFALKDGREGICHVSAVYPIDVWAEQEKQFSDPRYLEIMTKEEFEQHKQKFYQGLQEDCPRGMCYMGVEYECTLDGNLTFYDSAWLEEEPPVHRGSVTIRMMTLKPDDPVGPHGLPRRGCAIQTPVAPDVREMEAELFFYTERVPEWEEALSCPASRIVTQVPSPGRLLI